MRLRQSEIGTWARCPMQYRFQNIDNAGREQSSALSFGTALHDAILLMEEGHDLKIGLDRFDKVWGDLDLLDIQYDYIMPRNSHSGYRDEAHRILGEWWALIQWESDVVLAREHPFEVSLGERGHTLHGTVDKLALRRLKGGVMAVLISDYKTNAKAPTRDYLRHNVQFTAYAYASTQPEFWTGIENGAEIYKRYLDAPRVGEWVHLRGPRRIDAGERVARDFRRLEMVADNMEDSINMGIFVPNLSGETCEYCPFRRPCGLPTREEEGLA